MAVYKIGDVISNRYVIESILEPSVNSQSYLGNENYSLEKICIKLYFAQITSNFFNHPNFFLQTASISDFRHDNLCVSYEINQEMGMVFVVREYVQGQNFKDWLEKSKGTENFISKGIELLWQACQGLNTIHEKGLHLNIHPENIIISDVGTKLVDWDPRGITDIEFVNYLPSLSLYSSYRAPEIRIDGMPAGTSADLYSMGAVGFRLIFGTHPPERQEALNRALMGTSQEIRDFFLKALNPVPEQRFQDANEFADSLWNLSSIIPSSPDHSPERSGGALFAEVPDGQEPQSHSLPESESMNGFIPGSAPASSGFITDPIPPAAGFATIVDNSGKPQTPALSPESPVNQYISPLEVPVNSHETPVPDNSKKFSLEEKVYEHSPQSDSNYSMFGFKGLKNQQTGVYNPPQKKAGSPRMYIFAAVAALGIVFVVLAALIVKYLSAEKPQLPVREENVKVVEQEEKLSNNEPYSPPEEPESTPLSQRTLNEYNGSEQVRTHPEEDSWEETASQEVSVPTAKPEPEPEPQKDVEPKVSAEREKEVLEAFSNENWPGDPADCLRMADDLNDLGRSMEANLTYQHVLKYPGVTRKQKIHAYGAQAVTFNQLGQKTEALAVIESLLNLDPNNKFARSYKEKLKQ